jgi:hypothetical protein
MPVVKDLHGHPVLRRDGGYVGRVLSPDGIGWRKSVELRKKKRSSLRLLYITVLGADSTTSPCMRLRLRRRTYLLTRIVSEKLELMSWRST